MIYQVGVIYFRARYKYKRTTFDRTIMWLNTALVIATNSAIYINYVIYEIKHAVAEAIENADKHTNNTKIFHSESANGLRYIQEAYIFPIGVALAVECLVVLATFMNQVATESGSKFHSYTVNTDRRSQ